MADPTFDALKGSFVMALGVTLLFLGADCLARPVSRSWFSIDRDQPSNWMIELIRFTGIRRSRDEQSYNRFGLGIIACLLGLTAVSLVLINTFYYVIDRIQPNSALIGAMTVANPGKPNFLAVALLAIVLGVIFGLSNTRQSRLPFKVVASLVAGGFCFAAWTAASYHIGVLAQRWFVIGLVFAALFAITLRISNRYGLRSSSDT